MGGEFISNIKNRLCDAAHCIIICIYGSLSKQIVREVYE
jgi:hypothetical protein